MTVARLLVIALLCLGIAPREAAADAPVTLAVEAIGSLPGISDAELTRYLAREMGGTRLPQWRFAAGTREGGARNRVLWTFRPNPYAGGAVRQLGPSPHGLGVAVHKLLTVEVRLYLDGEYQKLSFGTARVRGGPEDEALSLMVFKLTLSLLSTRDFD